NRSVYCLGYSISNCEDLCAARAEVVSCGRSERVSVIDKSPNRQTKQTSSRNGSSKTSGYRRVASEGEDSGSLPRQQIPGRGELRSYSRSPRVGCGCAEGDQGKGVGTTRCRCRAGLHALLRRPERQAKAGRAPED